MGKQTRREPPEPESISDILRRAEQARGRHPTSKLTARIPVELHDWIRETAHSVTGHKRRGIQDLARIMLQYAREAIERGDLRIEAEARQTEYGIRRAGE
jgi:hypothetical protein